MYIIDLQSEADFMYKCVCIHTYIHTYIYVCIYIYIIDLQSEPTFFPRKGKEFYVYVGFLHTCIM